MLPDDRQGEHMAKKTMKVRRAPRKTAAPRRARRATLAELNAWITANHGALLKKAGANSIRLTGNPTFGDTRRKKPDRSHPASGSA
jgi:hypothetical protein